MMWWYSGSHHVLCVCCRHSGISVVVEVVGGSCANRRRRFVHVAQPHCVCCDTHQMLHDVVVLSQRHQLVVAIHQHVLQRCTDSVCHPTYTLMVPASCGRHIVLSCGEDAVTYQMDLREEKPTKYVVFGRSPTPSSVLVQKIAS